MGHFSKDCPLPRDYSKVKCSNCDESMELCPSSVSYTDMLLVGHTKVRCKQPPKEVETGFGDGDGADDRRGFDSVPAAAEGGDEWGSVAAEPIAVGGGPSW